MMKTYYVYILTNRSGTLYVGVTSDLPARLFIHRSGEQPGFVSMYKLDRLIYYEAFDDIEDAIRREKKLRLVAEVNPDWRDLSREIIGGKRSTSPTGSATVALRSLRSVRRKSMFVGG